ncbi:MAG: carboxypeptidase-like regulatory domain-containing protein, partial [Gemmatimonadaceae bacterium]
MQRKTLAIFVGVMSALSATIASAQTLRVVARDANTETVLPNVLLDVLRENGSVVSSTVTLADGSRLIQLPDAGTFRIRVRRIGFLPSVSSPVSVGIGETVRFEARVSAARIALPTVRVAEKSQCDLSSRSGGDAARLADVWEQMRTGLQISEAALRDERRDSTISRLQQSITRVSPRDGAILRHTVLPQRAGFTNSFGTFPIEDISANGYVRHDDGAGVYVAPNEHVIATDAFLAEHCFQLVADSVAHTGLIGLSFTPAPRRTQTEIAGTLWADAQSGTPHSLEFWYIDAHLPPTVRGKGKAGGEVYFGKLPNGTWAATGWLLRMPQTDLAQDRQSLIVTLIEVAAATVRSNNLPVTKVSTTDEPRLVTFQSFLGRFVPGGVDILTTPRVPGQPFQNGLIRLRQRIDSAAALMESNADGRNVLSPTIVSADTNVRSSSDGAAHVEQLPAGTYDVALFHTDREDASVEPERYITTVRSDSRTTLRITTSPLNAFAASCDAYPTARGVYGVLNIAGGAMTSAPLRQISSAAAAEQDSMIGAVVVARWTQPDGSAHERRGIADTFGRYSV